MKIGDSIKELRLQEGFSQKIYQLNLDYQNELFNVLKKRS